MIDDESEARDCDEVISYVQDEMNQEESEQNEVDGTKKGADSTGEVLHIEEVGVFSLILRVSRINHRLRGSASPVLTATHHSYGRPRLSDFSPLGSGGQTPNQF